MAHRSCSFCRSSDRGHRVFALAIRILGTGFGLRFFSTANIMFAFPIDSARCRQSTHSSSEESSRLAVEHSDDAIITKPSTVSLQLGMPGPSGYSAIPLTKPLGQSMRSLSTTVRTKHTSVLSRLRHRVGHFESTRALMLFFGLPSLHSRFIRRRPCSKVARKAHRKSSVLKLPSRNTKPAHCIHWLRNSSCNTNQARSPC